MRRVVFAVLMLSTLPASSARARASGDALEPLYQRIAADLRRGKPLVVTVHVALCDKRVIACGGRALGNGDEPHRNLYWGGAAGFEATFRRARGFRRIFHDRGDGKVILARSVYRRRVHPNRAWRQRGVRRPFELMVVGLAYRGLQIGRSMGSFVSQLHSERGDTLKLADGRALAFGGLGHVVGYAGHNQLMDVASYRWPAWRRQTSIGYFALACMTAPYLAQRLARPQAHGLLLTRVLMYPGAFTIVGLARGLAEGLPQKAVFARGADAYARAQKRPPKLIRAVFTHDARPRYRTRYLGSNAPAEHTATD